MTLSQTIGFYLALTGGTLSLAVISFCIVNLFLISKDKVNELIRGRRL